MNEEQEKLRDKFKIDEVTDEERAQLKPKKKNNYVNSLRNRFKNDEVTDEERAQDLFRR